MVVRQHSALSICLKIVLVLPLFMYTYICTGQVTHHYKSSVLTFNYMGEPPFIDFYSLYSSDPHTACELSTRFVVRGYSGGRPIISMNAVARMDNDKYPNYDCKYLFLGGEYADFRLYRTTCGSGEEWIRAVYPDGHTAGQCIPRVSPPPPLTLTLTLAPNQKDPRPLKAEGNDGKSTHELIATVMEGSTPKAGVAVTFGVEVEANSGGHDHHDASRPKGEVKANSHTTDAKGEIKVTFQASQIAGKHVVAAVCRSCTNTSVTKNVDVKVPDLVPFLVLPLSGMQWNPNGVGDTPQHTDNHYLTMAATYRMLEIASKFKKIWPTAPQLTLNDASLKWGGKFDIDGTWEVNPRKHAEHRLGDNIDIRANTRPGNVPSDIRKVVFRWLRDESTKEDEIPVDLKIRSVNPLHEGAGLPNEHFHLRLGN